MESGQEIITVIYNVDAISFTPFQGHGVCSLLLNNLHTPASSTDLITQQSAVDEEKCPRLAQVPWTAYQTTTRSFSRVVKKRQEKDLTVHF